MARSRALPSIPLPNVFGRAGDATREADSTTLNMGNEAYPFATGQAACLARQQATATGAIERSDVSICFSAG